MAKTIGHLLATLGVDTKGLDQAAAKMKTFEKNTVSSFSNMRKGMDNFQKKTNAVGRSMTTKLTLPLAGLATGIIAAGSRFEKSMSGVEAVTGATGKTLEDMTALARELGETTEWSASQAAEGMRFLGMAGFEANEILTAMPNMLDLATAGQLDLARAADISSNVLTGFNMEAEEMGRVADVLAKAAASSNTNVAQLGDAMSYAAPLASGLGVSLESATAAVALFSNAGIQGQTAGTSLRQVLSALSGPTTSAKNALEEMGISMQDINPEVNSLASIIDTLKEGGLSAAEAVDLFGTRAGTGLSVLLSAGSEELIKYEQLLQEAGGSAKTMADIMRDNVKGQLAELKSAIESVAISFFDVMAPALEKVIAGLTKFSKWLANSSPEVKKNLMVIATVLGVGGPVLLAISAFTKAILVLASPTGAVMLAIVAIAAAWAKWGEDIKAFIQGVIDAFKRMVDTIVDIKDKVAGAVKGIRDKTVGAFGNMKNKVGEHVKSLKDNTIGRFTEMWDTLVGHSIVPDMADAIVNVYQNMTDDVFDIIDFGATKVENRMQEMASKTVTSSKNILSGIGKGQELEGGSFYKPYERTGAWFGDLDITPIYEAENALNGVKTKTDELAIASGMWASKLSEGLANAIVKGEDLGDVLDGILKQLASSVLQKMFLGFLPFADGGVIDKGKVTPFAKGGIVNKPTLFPMANGAGLMGEAGPEVIMPLKRNSQGKLGVEGGGGGTTNITMNVNAVDAASFVQMLNNNKAAVTSLIVENVSNNGQIRRAMQGAR